MKVRAKRAAVVLTLATAMLLVACGSSQRRNGGPTLADLQPLALPEASRALPSKDIDQVLAQYQAVLEVAVEPETRIRVQQRLAGLEMLRSEERQLNAPATTHYFDDAIALYQTLIDAHPGRADNDRLLYQIAKAYELDGRIEEASAVLEQLAREYPGSEYYPEARFRSGEILFSQQRYALAEQAYASVVAAGSDSAYHANAIYMRGWSLFKLSRYEESLRSFTRVLDRTIEDRARIDELARAEREMAQDTLRVMSLAFSYLQGPESLKSHLAAGGARSYQHLLYEGLGQLYLEKERYRDSAETYALYVQQYPDSDYAPDFSVRLIDVYQQGGFPSEILPAKEDFAKRYGLHSRYWSSKDAAVHQRLRPHLYQYLEELAKHYHASAQIMQRQQSSSPVAQQTGSRDIRASFLTAGNWYAQFAETFPDDAKTPAMVFLMAESLVEAGEFPRAIAAYERVAYGSDQQHDPVQGAEAGYSAILAYDSYLPELPPERSSEWQVQKIESELRFAEVYPGDPRALSVLSRAAEELLQSGNAGDAVTAASRVTAWQPQAPVELRRTAWLVQGHGNYQLGDYVRAEQAYYGALAVIVSEDKDRSAVVDRLAASVYKQAETHLAADDKAAAIDDYLRVARVAPDSDIAIAAQYDAANGLIDIEDWSRAEQVLIEFRNAYPEHDLADSIPAKLVSVYQHQGNWLRAADELTVIAAEDADAEVRRQSLYMAAELYQKAGAVSPAIQRYTEYVDNWPQPFDLSTEARFQLTLLYQQVGDGKRYRYWLQRLMASHDNAAGNATDRSRYLAAMAATVFAQDAYGQFTAVPLNLPLKTSFKIKRSSMQATLQACDRVLEYGVAEFVTQASFLIGSVYATLSSDLMASERPLNLGALELEQYELLLEEQAYPFEEKAIDIHEANARRSWAGVYDQWVRSSMESLALLLPARYGKTELLVRYSNDIY